MTKRTSFWAWAWLFIGGVYLLLPLYGTFDFSLRATRGTLSLTAYQSALSDPEFARTFTFSLQMAVLTILFSILLIVPTAYWVHLRLPRVRPLIEFITLLPFVIPAIVLVFGMIKLYSRPLTFFTIPLLPPLTNSTLGTNFLLIAGYTVLSLPYMYRAVDTGLRAIDIRTLTEAAQSLGANWFTILARIILPNLRTALLSGALLTFATVIGELTLATFLARPAFGPYLQLLGNHKTYEPSALALISFVLTWAAMALIQYISHGNRQRTQVAGAH
jgi:putative spermidine/putrescine transport system permease protein